MELRLAKALPNLRTEIERMKTFRLRVTHLDRMTILWFKLMFDWDLGLSDPGPHDVPEAIQCIDVIIFEVLNMTPEELNTQLDGINLSGDRIARAFRCLKTALERTLV